MNGLSISLSGLQASLRRLDSAANNIANLNTPGFRAQRDSFGDTVEAAAAPAADDTNPLAPSDVNLAEEQVRLLTSEVSARANINAIRAQDEILRQLVDLGETKE